MPRRGASARRPVAGRAARLLLAVGVASLGYASVTDTLAFVLRADPERAHRLVPGNARVAALLAQARSGADATAADRAGADRLARRALQGDATAVAAAATLGINAQVRGDVAGARALFGYAQRLSRRDLQTQIWAIEDAVGRGNVKEALRHYDIALRTSRLAPDLLFPVLGSAIGDPAIASALADTLAAKPVWGESFINHVTANGPDARATARLLGALRRRRVPVSDVASAAAIDKLVAAEFFDDAWAYYSLVRPGVDRRASRDPFFTADLAAPSRFDWVPINDAGVTTSIQRGGRGGVFDFAVPASVGGPLLQQLQLLPPGDYRLEGHSGLIDQPERSRPYWVLSCRDGRELGRLILPNSRQANGKFAGSFTVPLGCPAQTLALVARPSDAVGGGSGQIDQIRLVPLRRSASSED